jgi:hypothetical protein
MDMWAEAILRFRFGKALIPLYGSSTYHHILSRQSAGDPINEKVSKIKDLNI